MKKIQIQESLKQDIKKKQNKTKGIVFEPDTSFYTALCAYCLDKDLHMKTIFLYVKNKKVQQMLLDNFDNTIKDLNMHRNTVLRLQEDVDLRLGLNNCLEKVGKIWR